MDSPPVLFEVGSELGESYIAAMELAGEYAYAGRDVVVAQGARDPRRRGDARGAQPPQLRVAGGALRPRRTGSIRKGCTPARPGQEGFVGGSMGDESVILEGVESDENERVALLDRPRRRPGDEPHAGRRPRAAAQAVGVHAPRLRSHLRRTRAVDVPRPSGRSQLRRSGSRSSSSPGVVDWPAVQARLREQGIVLVGGGADEAPEVYKRLPDVLAAHGGLDPGEAHAPPARRRDGRPRRASIRTRTEGPRARPLGL